MDKVCWTTELNVTKIHILILKKKFSVYHQSMKPENQKIPALNYSFYNFWA